MNLSDQAPSRATKKHVPQLYHAALRVGVHDSDDWESINLGNIHTMGFRCSVLD